MAWVKITGLIGLVCALAGVSPAFGFQQSTVRNSYIITKYDTYKGVSLKSTTDVTASADGYLYGATGNGLLQMDGIHTFLHSGSTGSGFKTNRISRVLRLNDLIIVHDNLQYLYEFKNGQARPLLHPETGEHLRAPIIRQLSTDFFILDNENSYLWSGGQVRILTKSLSSYDSWDALSVGDSTVFIINTDGLYKVDNEQSRKIDFPDYFNPDLTYTTGLVLSGKLLKVVGKNEIASYDIRENAWIKELYLSVPDPATEIIHTLSLPGNKGYLVGTTSGFLLQTKDEIRRVYESRRSLPYNSYFEHGGDEYLAGADGVWINGEKIFTPSNSLIADADIDREGSLWVTVMGEGIYRISKNPFHNYTDPRITNTYSLVETDEGFWVGSFENGLHRLYNDRIVESYDMSNTPFPTDIIRSISKLQNGNLLVATWGAPPFVFRNGRFYQEEDFWPLFGKRTNTVEGFYEDPEGRWWIGTLDGLSRKENGRYQPFFDKNRVTLSKVSKILPSPFSDDLFFCTKENGVVILRENEFLFAGENHSGIPVHARDTYFLSEDTMLVATYEHGLQRYILEGNKINVKSLNKKNGLPTPGFHQFLRDSTGYFWISSNNGLLRVSEENLLHTFEEGGALVGQRWFRTAEGIMEPEFNGGSQNTGLVDRNQDFWFTNLDGLVSFNPYELNFREITSNDFRVQQVITDSGSVFVSDDELTTLSKTSRNPRILFSHMSFTDNQTNLVWYKLKESEKWIRPENPGEIQLSGLDGGIHTLLFSINPNGNEILKSYRFRIRPYIYETTWFQLLALLVTIGFIYPLISRRKKKRNTESPEQKEKPNTQSSNGHYSEIPEEKTASPVPEPLAKMQKVIQENYTDPDLTITGLADMLNTSKSALYREWNKYYEQSIADYITDLRIEKAKQLIQQDRLTISEVADQSGFNSQSYFAKVFKKKVGISPTQYE